TLRRWRPRLRTRSRLRDPALGGRRPPFIPRAGSLISGPPPPVDTLPPPILRACAPMPVYVRPCPPMPARRPPPLHGSLFQLQLPDGHLPVPLGSGSLSSALSPRCFRQCFPRRFKGRNPGQAR